MFKSFLDEAISIPLMVYGGEGWRVGTSKFPVLLAVGNRKHRRGMLLCQFISSVTWVTHGLCFFPVVLSFQVFKCTSFEEQEVARGRAKGRKESIHLRYYILKIVHFLFPLEIFT